MAEHEAPPRIEVSDLRKSYGGLEALKGISFSIRAGEICGYLGPNGAGKSTTVKILTGLLRADAGSARVAGFDPAVDPVEAKRRLGYVPESAALFEALTAYEYLTFVGGLHGIPDRDLRFRIGEFMRLFQLGAEASQRMSGYSKGMKQKVAIAAALLHDPPVVLLDEPLSGLDANAAFVVKEILRSLAREGKAVLFCSHVLEVVERLCDRVVIIDRGEIVADGPMERIKSTAGLEDFFRRLTSGEDLSAVAEGFLKSLREGPR
jgi:ABC-2 type transport system ATP-binding protein